MVLGSRPELAGGYLSVRTQEPPGKGALGRESQAQSSGAPPSRPPPKLSLWGCGDGSSEKERCQWVAEWTLNGRPPRIVGKRAEASELEGFRNPC